MIDSPCINVCHMSPRLGVCTGCCRTLDEIARWSELSEAERRRVTSALPRRRQRLGLAEAAPAPER
ncbi:MAG TPA: DUF1289 domain-containing protein [Burkholderiales bacterium]|nr:DUF1289 domain-containing protein [Burkholderiales bacterium]